MTLPERLEKIRSELELTQQEMADKLGISKPAWQGYVSGKNVPGGKVFESLLAEGFSSDWLLTGEGSMNRASTTGARKPRGARGSPDDLTYVAYYRDVEASGGAGAIPLSEEAPEFLAFRRRWVAQELGAKPDDLAVIRMTGESMEPTLKTGDVLLLDRRAVAHQGDGIYVIRRRDRLQVKRLQFLATKLRITSDNPAYEPEEIGEDLPEIELIGRVVWVGRKL